MTILELNHVGFRYRPDRPVLEDVNCRFETGVFYALVGKSGAGKSTLLSLMAGLDLPTEGEILFEGRSTAGMDLSEYRRRYASVIYQDFALLPLLTQNAVGVGHPRRAVRLIERISIRAVRRVSCFRRVQSGPFAGAPQRGLHDLLRKRPHQRMLCQRAGRICRRADCFCGARPGDQLCRRHAESLCKLFDGV